jgi:hypothetical protein
VHGSSFRELNVNESEKNDFARTLVKYRDVGETHNPSMLMVGDRTGSFRTMRGEDPSEAAWFLQCGSRKRKKKRVCRSDVQILNLPILLTPLAFYTISAQKASTNNRIFVVADPTFCGSRDGIYHTSGVVGKTPHTKC